MKRLIERLKRNLDPYKPMPFWSWNDELDPEELKRQIRWMHKQGLGGFIMPETKMQLVFSALKHSILKKMKREYVSTNCAASIRIVRC